jgi:tropomodulin
MGVLQQESVSELRATNQAAQCLGNRVEMAITKSIENNKTLLKVGLQFEFNDCRNRVAVHLQKNLDRIRENAVFFCLLFYLKKFY